MNYKNDFPIFKNRKDFIYLNSAATTLKPQFVIDGLIEYYTKLGANVGRGEAKDSIETTNAVEQSRDSIASFLNIEKNNIIFTPSATYSFNIIVHGLKNSLNKGDEIILSHLEHSSNILPWKKIASEMGLKIIIAPLKEKEYVIDIQKLKQIINKNTKVISINHVSNSIGSINDVKEIIEIAKSNNIISIIDACQSIGHMPIDVNLWNPDFLVFSPHKMFADPGVGILYGKIEMLEKLELIFIGGESFNKNKYSLEIGTPNIAGIISIKYAIEYIEKIGLKKIWNHSIDLKKYAVKKLSNIKGITIYNKKGLTPLLGFNIKGKSPQDINQQLSHNNISIRSGRNCVPYIEDIIGEKSYSRLSFSIYNSKEDIDKVYDVLNKEGDLLDAFFE